MRIADWGLRIVNGDRRFMAWATAVLLLAAFFRLFALQDVPPGLAQDEVLDADIALFIRGGLHAFFFREGYGHEPLYHYLAAPFAPLLGDNMLAVRLPSVFLGLLLVALTLRWAKREFGTITAVAAGLGLAVSWWPIIFSRIGIRPILLPVLLLLAVWFWRRPSLAGLFLGLSFYSYTAARIIFLLPIGYALLRRLAGQRQIGGLAWQRWLLITLGVFTLVAAPMQITLWRDPTLQQRVEQLAGPLESLQQGDVGPIMESGLRTLGVFSFTGDPRWTYSLPERPLFDPATALLFYAGLALALWRWREGRMALLLVWLGVALLPSAVTPQAPSTVRLVGGMPVVYTLVGLVVSRGWRAARYPLPAIRYLFAIALAALLVGNIARTVQDGAGWAGAAETRLEHYQATLLEISRYLRANPTDGPVVVDGFYEPIDRDSLRRSLGNEPTARWVQTGAGVAGALVWPAEQGENGRLFVPEYAPVPPDLLAAAAVSERPLYRSSTWPSFAVYALPAPAGRPATPPLARFNDALSLTGYEIAAAPTTGQATLYTWWQVTDNLPTDLSIFLHLVNAAGEVVAQHDGLDAAPATLQPGDVILQRHVLALPPDLPAGQYVWYVGVYERGNGRRWQHSGDPTDRWLLPPLTIDE